MRMRIASRVRIARPATVLAGATALTLAGLAVPAGATAGQAGSAASTRDPYVTRLFSYVGPHTQRFFVPSGVRYLTVWAAGASGQGNDHAAGGLGANVRSTVAVSPHSTLLVRVGGSGRQGGFNGGGYGPGLAGTGGGASSVTTVFGRPLVVAGGGGGAGNRGSCLSAGGDGGNAGQAGSPGGQCTTLARGGRGGGAGLHSSGGAGGLGGFGATVSGRRGDHGVRNHGGGGKTTFRTLFGASGGGGGGYFGGGAGGSGGRHGFVTGAGGGGGGGSSLGYVMGSAFGPTSVRITYRVSRPLAIVSFSPLPAGSVGQFYQKVLAASGGRPPYFWSLAFGHLPAGLALSHSGVISGTPTVAGTTLFSVRVSDAARSSVSKLFRLTVVGRADLAIHLTHHGPFEHHHDGRFLITVTNAGSAATSTFRPTEVVLTLPRGLEARQGGVGTFWECRKHLRSTLCVRRAPIHAHETTTITVTVFVAADAGSFQRAEATVYPIDATPGDNSATDLVHIFKQ